MHNRFLSDSSRFIIHYNRTDKLVFANTYREGARNKMFLILDVLNTPS
jgi:hypothetical protein